MPTLTAFIDLDRLLDLAAIAGSVSMLLFLLRNRLKYGRLYLSDKSPGGRMDFSGEMALLRMSQKYQKAHDHLQRMLTKEFQSLGMTGSMRPNLGPEPGRGAHVPLKTPDEVENRRRAYRLAEQMIARGEEDRKIMQHCNLVESELELLQGLRRLAEDPRA